MENSTRFRTQFDNEKILTASDRGMQRPPKDRQSALLLFGPNNEERFAEAWRKDPLRFEVKRHHATHLHTDFRLEVFGRLITWAFYPQPSLNPNRWISAREQADHGLAGLDKERVVPPGYGAGPMLVWDKGTFHPLQDRPGTGAVAALLALREGRFDLWLTGKRLNGGFRIERTDHGWRLRKLEDEFSTRERIELEDRSILTNRTLDDIVADEMRRREPRSEADLSPSLFDDYL